MKPFYQKLCQKIKSLISGIFWTLGCGLAIIVILGMIFGRSSPNTTANIEKPVAANAASAPASVSTSPKELYVTKFNLIASIQGNKLSVKLDSDVPDGMAVKLSAGRIYKIIDDESHKSEEMIVNYFDTEAGTIALKKGMMYDISPEQWVGAFNDAQMRHRQLGKRVVPGSISNSITITAVIPQNEAFSGPAVKREYGTKYLTAEKQVAAPVGMAVAISDPHREGVRIGMTKEEVLRSNWGRPEHKNITATINGASEQWVYRSGNYLYFQNGILTSVQTH